MTCIIRQVDGGSAIVKNQKNGTCDRQAECNWNEMRFAIMF
jgi:hypothetical protein